MGAVDREFFTTEAMVLAAQQRLWRSLPARVSAVNPTIERLVVVGRGLI